MKKIRLAGTGARDVLGGVKYLGASILLFALLLTGCSSYVAAPQQDNKVATYQRYFVKSNFNDNHGIDARIVEALKDHGVVAEKGPLTMMPATTQAVVSYEDHWTWDFKTHLTGLRIFINDAKSQQLQATAIFTGPTSLMTSTDDVVDRLVKQLLKVPPKPSKK